MLTSTRVLHVALTPLAGSPIQIVNALNRHTQICARLVVLNPHIYGDRTFGGDLNWMTDREEAVELLRYADVVHMHHYFELDHNAFGVDFRDLCDRAHFIRQFHTHPLTIARGSQTAAQRLINTSVPQLVVAQYHERYYPRARIVPNIVPIDHDLYTPVPRDRDNPVIFFAPTFEHSAWEVPEDSTRWETKGAPETEALLHDVVEGCGKGRVVVRRNVPHEQCLREKQRSDLVVDELVTGSYHLSSLEALSQGLPTFAYLDERTLGTLAELTGTHNHPWLNFRLEELEKPLQELIKEGDLRRELGDYARKWMETYYSDQKMVTHYVRAYEDLLERPEEFNKLRFDLNSRRMIWLAQRRDDLVWDWRRERFGNHGGKPQTKVFDSSIPDGSRTNAIHKWFKKPMHNLLKKLSSVRMEEIYVLQKRLAALENALGFVSAGEVNRWLYENRQERMDATVDIFDPTRREFHLERYRFAAELVEGKRVLDCSCGTGYGSQMLVEKGRASLVLGVDVDNNSIRYARATHQVNSSLFICSSGDRLPFVNGCVDVVVSFETVEHVSNDASLIEEFHRVLRPDGILIISTPNQWPLEASPFHKREYNRELFLGLLEARFACEKMYNQNSGSGTPYNHGQSAGIIATTSANEHLAECFLAVCHRKAVDTKFQTPQFSNETEVS